MSKQRKPNDYRKLLESLADFIEENSADTEEELDERIKDIGHEPRSLVSQMRARIKKSIEQSPLNWRTRTAEIEKKRENFREFAVDPGLSLDHIKQEIMQLIQGREVAFHNRNLDVEKRSRADLVQLLAELRFQAANRKQNDNEQE